jgi:hypothetical protein
VTLRLNCRLSWRWLTILHSFVFSPNRIDIHFYGSEWRSEIKQRMFFTCLPFDNTAHLEMNKETGLYPLSYKQTAEKNVWCDIIISYRLLKKRAMLVTLTFTSLFKENLCKRGSNEIAQFLSIAQTFLKDYRMGLNGYGYTVPCDILLTISVQKTIASQEWCLWVLAIWDHIWVCRRKYEIKISLNRKCQIPQWSIFPLKLVFTAWSSIHVCHIVGIAPDMTTETLVSTSSSPIYIITSFTPGIYSC